MNGWGPGTWPRRLARLRPLSHAARTVRALVPPADLLRDALYRRLWLSLLASSLGAQIAVMALPLTAAVLLGATPTQMGWLTAMEVAPFALFSLPSGVWLDRVRKLPVYIGGELLVAAALGSVPVAWALGALQMPYLYGVAFVVGFVTVTAGSATQIVLTQVVPRPRLVEAHARNALAGSTAELGGPPIAGALIRAVGAPLALLATALLLLVSVSILRGLRVSEPPQAAGHRPFWPALADGLRFVRGQRLLVVMAVLVGTWELCHHTAFVVQILYATRELRLDEGQIGLCYLAAGLGTILASTVGHRLSSRLGVGACMLIGIALTGAGWLQLALVPPGRWGVAAFVLMLVCFGAGAVFIFINFLALRQAATPEPLLGRMTSTMRWLILLPAAPGALAGGWLGEHLGLRWALAAAGAGALALAAAGWRFTRLRQQRHLPEPPAP